MAIRYELVAASARKTPPRSVEGFGLIRTNHMFMVNYKNGAWQDPRIVPYGPFSLMPGALALHYGQAIFEGAKAFRHANGEIYVFRFEENARRMNHSAEVLVMPTIPEELQIEGALRLLDLERDWCPSEPEASMYIRPFMFATQDVLGVRPSDEYIYCIMLSPSGAYYKGGFSRAIKLLLTSKFHRAVSGGTGTAKACGNYASSMRAAEYAHKVGADQVLYLDATNEYLEEAGAMNHYHVLADGTFIIPAFNDSILRSITSLSVLELAKLGHCQARQECIKVTDFLADIKSGKITEAGGFGTAAVISPVGRYMMDDGQEIQVGDGQIGKHTRALYELYTGMQTGRLPAPEGWLKQVQRYRAE